MDSDAPSNAPTWIGPYRLHELLGEGGMGSVYRAVQAEPVRREVALKVVKVGMDTKEVVARFESERQALAVMDHSSIAKVLDAGATAEGRPYFVMELVRGVPITEYCDTHRLGTAERLELFSQVCEAVQHAHYKGVIHRDLKPSNVLVTVQDARPLAKVIDFGIAKAVAGSLTDATMVTTLGQILGTPAYMSPEQAERTSLDVDSRTDLYSLGVILYELLVGALPFERDALRRPDFVMQHLLRERAVPTPSARLGSLADTQETVARNRATDVRTLRRELSGDLDWIVVKAMARDRTRRYGSAGELAADLRRYLAGETVSARPPTLKYRLGKLARRHRGALAAGVALALSLTGGAAVSAIGFVRAERSAERAEAEAERAEAVSGFLDRMLRAADPVRGVGPSTTVEEVLDAASLEVEEGALADQPLVEVAVRRSIGGTYLLLGRLERAEQHLEEAGRLLGATPGAEPLELVGVLDELGQLRRSQGDPSGAERLYREALAVADAHGLIDDGDAGERMANKVRNDLGLALRDSDRIEEAAAIYEALAASERELLAPDDLDLATTLNNLALVKRAQGDDAAAEALFQETLGVLRAAFGESHIYVAAVLESIGSLEQRAGRYREADSLMTTALEMRRAIVGDRHPDLINGLNGLGLLHMEMDDLVAAGAYLDDALRLAEEVHGADNTRTASIVNSIGLLHLREGNPVAAEVAFRRVVAIREDALGPRHRNTVNAQGNLAAALLEADRATDAEALARRVVATGESIELGDRVMLAGFHRIWGRSLLELGRYEEAEAQLIVAHGMHEAELGAGHRRTVEGVESLVMLYERWERPAEADAWRARSAAAGEMPGRGSGG